MTKTDSRKHAGIVILNYNSHDLTVALANKVAEMDAVDEVCVVDNCSRDDFDGDFHHPKIHYIKNTRNAGYSAGNNVGLRYLVEERRCEYVFIANPDVVFGNETIEEMCKALDDDPQLALVSTKHLGHKGSMVFQYYDFHNYWRSVANCFFIFRKKYEERKCNYQNKIINDSKKPIYVDAVPGCFFGMKAEFLRKNDYLYEGIFMYGEEYVIGKQAQLAGYGAAILPTVTFVHDHEHKPLQNPMMFKNDRASLRQYFHLFGNLSAFQKFVLDMAVKTGTFEYGMACNIKHLFTKRNRMKILDLQLAQWIWYTMVKAMPQTCAKILYWKALGKWPNFKHPKDLNEKINYLKFHADMHEWARLADKYAVREYVQDRGLSHILPKLVGGVNLIP